MKTVIDLMREYVRVADMCKGTPLENNPWECVRLKSDKSKFSTHPYFDNFHNAQIELEFSIAILEGKGVFVGDKLYYRTLDQFTVAYCDQPQDFSDCSWTPPTPKRTFMLELDDMELSSLINIVSKNNWTDVMVNLGKKLTEARDKEIHEEIL